MWLTIVGSQRKSYTVTKDADSSLDTDPGLCLAIGFTDPILPSDCSKPFSPKFRSPSTRLLDCWSFQLPYPESWALMLNIFGPCRPLLPVSWVPTGPVWYSHQNRQRKTFQTIGRCLKYVEGKNLSDSGGHSKHTEWPAHLNLYIYIYIYLYTDTLMHIIVTQTSVDFTWS